jgi:hypothetical protein
VLRVAGYTLPIGAKATAIVMRLLAEAYRLVDSVAEFLAWREDWNRTSSPVSYLLAAATAIGLLVVLYFYAGELWKILVRSTRVGG